MSNGWEEVDYYPAAREQNALRKKFEFKNFADALLFVNTVGELAEKANHHPDINFGWGYAQIWLTTHSEHSVTKKDHELAQAIDQIQE